jgi:probable F420-dependent oxidoreductase
MARPIRIGVQLWPGGTPSYSSWRDAVLRAEDMGVDVVFGYDHFHKPFVQRSTAGPKLQTEQPDVNNFEAWTALASWAEVTSNVEIGTLVTGMGYRNPDLLADMARTVDHISGGRLILGVGAGRYEKDYAVYGYPYGTVRSRMDLFADGLQRIDKRLRLLKPEPVRDIPILVGGSGEKKTLPLVGRYASIWHSAVDLDAFRRKSDLVRKHVTAAGRDDTVVERAVSWPGDGTSADAYAAEGATLFITEIHPTDQGHDLSPLKELLAWRGQRNSL